MDYWQLLATESLRGMAWGLTWVVICSYTNKISPKGLENSTMGITQGLMRGVGKKTGTVTSSGGITDGNRSFVSVGHRHDRNSTKGWVLDIKNLRSCSGTFPLQLPISYAYVHLHKVCALRMHRSGVCIIMSRLDRVCATKNKLERLPIESDLSKRQAFCS